MTESTLCAVQYLSECMVVSLDHAGGEIDTEDDVMVSEDDGKTPAFHVVGTTDRVEERREYLVEEYLVSVVVAAAADDLRLFDHN